VPGAERDAAGVRSATKEPLHEVTGPLMAAALRSALAWLQANQDLINDLNVFPVPDGDTGSNMYLTLRSAVEDVEKGGEVRPAAAVMQSAAHGSLMGARGNSGVILSQVLRGFAQELANHERVDAAGIAAALQEASNVAYKAVMKPTEGTVLTVVREAAAAARQAADGSDDIHVVLDAAVREAHDSVDRTPQQLAVLRDAGVVDAGGFGFTVILEGFARALEGVEVGLATPPPPRRVGEPQLRPPGFAGVEGRRGAAAVAAREEGWGYCTEFLIHGPGLDLDRVRGELAPLGESSLVVGDPDLIRVHIHTHEPALLIGAAARQGRLSKLKVEDMSAQHHDVLDRAAAEEAAGGRANGADLPGARHLGVVAVAPGTGFREIFRGLGVDQVVEGGQTMNPSIEDLLNGVRESGAGEVILLPNNGNVILTAQQVDDLAGETTVRVVPSRNLPQGISALLALDPTADLDENARRMEEAMAGVRTVEITRAVRDSTANGRTIHAGDVIAVVDDRITEVGDDNLAVAQAVLTNLPDRPELVTVYSGAGVAEEEAEKLVSALRTSHSDIEFELHPGGQEHYPYILSLE